MSIYFLGLFRAFHFILCLQNLEHSFLIFWYLERKLVTQFFFERSIFKWRFEDYFINIFGLKKSCKVPKKIKATQKEVIACFLYSENCFFLKFNKKEKAYLDLFLSKNSNFLTLFWQIHKTNFLEYSSNHLFWRLWNLFFKKKHKHKNSGKIFKEESSSPWFFLTPLFFQGWKNAKKILWNPRF